MIVIPDRIISSDGFNVIVSERDLRIKNRLYRMEQVKGYGVAVRKPERLRGLVLCGAGFMTMIFVSNSVLFWLGGLTIVTGIISIFMAKRRYSMRISTPLGEQDILVSEKKETISRIVEAIDEIKWLKTIRGAEKK